MQDVQNREDARGIAIQRVGIKDAHLPFLIKTKEGGFQQVLARIRFTVALPSEYKGTHMSRFLEILMPWSQKPLAELIDLTSLADIDGFCFPVDALHQTGEHGARAEFYKAVHV